VRVNLVAWLKSLFAPRSSQADTDVVAPDRAEPIAPASRDVAPAREAAAPPPPIPADDGEPGVATSFEAPPEAPHAVLEPAEAVLEPAEEDEAIATEPRAPVLAPSEPAPDVVEPAAAAARAEIRLVLRLETEGGPAPTFEVAKTGAVLGRGEENSIRLNDLSVSRRHARITYRQGGFWVTDLGSTSGTWVDGVRLNAPRRVAVGQVIDVGVCRLMVAEAEEGAKAPAKPARTPEPARRGGRRDSS
jgi:hypothetical protein